MVNRGRQWLDRGRQWLIEGGSGWIGIEEGNSWLKATQLCTVYLLNVLFTSVGNEFSLGETLLHVEGINKVYVA